MIKLPPNHPLHLVIGFTIWSLWFIVIYSGLSLSCMAVHDPALRGPFSGINWGLFIFTLLTTLFLLWLAYLCRPRDSGPSEVVPELPKFIRWMASAAYLCAAVATLAVGLPALVLPPCL